MTSFISPKNELQEFFQKQKKPLPKYVSTNVSQNDKILWKSSLYIDNKEVLSETSTSKKEAEQLAASIYLAQLKLIKCSIKKNSFPPRSVLIVDVENRHKFIDEFIELYDNVDIYAFMSRTHHLANKIFQKSTKILVDSTRPDGTDTCIQVYVGALLISEKYDNYFIVTADHYGSALIEMIDNGNLLWKPKKSYLLTNIQDIPHFTQ